MRNRSHSSIKETCHTSLTQQGVPYSHSLSLLTSGVIQARTFLRRVLFPKPFDPDSLRATVKSLIRNRKILQDKVLNLTSTTLKEPKKVEEAKLNPAEKVLVEKIHAYLDANLDNEHADISEMARELGISYSSLYAKVKSLTGKTPKAFASAYRMNIARELLRSEGLTVSEVAWKLGCSSPSVFTREFKNHFGYPPSHEKPSDSNEK